MNDRIDITGGHVRITEEDHHSSRELEHLKRIEEHLRHVEDLLRVQTKLLHQILAREPNWYPRTTNGAITVK